jgi:hypothetical protein
MVERMSRSGNPATARPRARAALLAAALASLPARVALAEDAEQKPVEPLAVAAAVIPGILLHGAGHYVSGERETARRLLVVEGIALGSTGAGAVLLGVSGASRWVSGPAIGLGAAGIGVLALGWLADIYGAAGGARMGGRPLLRVPPVEVRLGYAYVRDPQFDYASFAVIGAELLWRRLRFDADAHLAADDDNQRVRAEGAYRLARPRARRGAADGSRLEVGGAAVWHRFGTEAYSVTGAEVFAASRLDLRGLGRSLDGSFAELDAGVQLERIAYGGVAGADYNTQLLFRAGFGVYAGTPAGRHGEIQLYYDHRRDDLAGGLALSRGGGFLGHFGLAGWMRLTPTWGLAGEMELGSANVVRVSATRQLGSPRPPRCGGWPK